MICGGWEPAGEAGSLSGMKTLRTLFAPALAATALWLSQAMPGAAAPLPLATVSSYLNSIEEVQTDFTQVNPDGSTSAGVLKIKRPGRMRFEYNKPDKTLVMAGGGQVAIFDAKSNQPPEQYPLSRTPLNLILARNIDLGRAKMVVGHGEQGGMTTVTAQDPDHPEAGTITMFFTEQPVALKQWIVTDDSGGKTLVKLGALQKGDFPPSTFSIPNEQRRR